MGAAKEIMTVIQSQNLPIGQTGYPDICKITDASVKEKVLKFISDVNSKGGFLPTPKCNA